MGRIHDGAGRLRDLALAAARSTGAAARDLGSRLIGQARLTIDRERWTAALDWRGRLAAVSWPRAGVGLGLAAGLVFGLWFAFKPAELRPHPPRLPTEAEWRATQAAARAMEAELSPALAAANRSEGSGARP